MVPGGWVLIPFNALRREWSLLIVGCDILILPRRRCTDAQARLFAHGLRRLAVQGFPGDPRVHHERPTREYAAALGRGRLILKAAHSAARKLQTLRHEH